jgi:hypothetical protein
MTAPEDIWCPVCNWQAPRDNEVCELHGEENPPQVRGSEGSARYDRGTNTDGPGGALTPLSGASPINNLESR